MEEIKVEEAAPDVEMPVRVLIVDNEREIARGMAEALERVGYRCTTAFSGPEGAEMIDAETFEVVVTDLVMNDFDGMDILRRAGEKQPNCEVILVTGHASVPKAVEAMQQGAFNFLEKPVSPTRLRVIAKKAAEAVLNRAHIHALNERLDQRYGFEKIVYSSDAMRQVIERLRRVSPTDVSVLINGPTGTGKELIAQAIHQNSPRRKKPFVAINCGAISEHLVESELFGHVKGAFTDAIDDRVGKFEYANGGTIFLDEVGDIPKPTQVKLLRVLQEREITRVGDNKPKKVNVRVLSATNVDLEDAVDAGDFRSDLYYRLKVVNVVLPPLSERREDIVPLADFFRRRAARRHQKEVKSISPEVMRSFFAHDWKGNVRELENTIESMAVLDMDEVLDVDDLPPDFAEPITSDSAPLSGPSDLIGKTMNEIEKWAIENTLAMTGGNRDETAKILGMAPRTIYRKLEKYGLS